MPIDLYEPVCGNGYSDVGCVIYLPHGVSEVLEAVELAHAHKVKPFATEQAVPDLTRILV